MRDELVVERLVDLRARTRERITALSRDFDDIVERSADAVRDDEHDPEGATIAFERAQVAALLRDAEAQLDEIDLALDRVARGVHGTCERCGAPIPRDRHLARPATRTCISCAQTA